jgi:hypothetical protein
VKTSRSQVQLTLLQTRLACEALGIALDTGHSVAFQIAGDTEVYVRAEVGGVSIFLYDDGFDLQGTNLDKRFEADDIVSADDASYKLKECLVAALVK